MVSTGFSCMYLLLCPAAKHHVEGEGTDTSAVFILNMAILESKLDFLLVLCREFVVAVDEISVASARLVQVLDLLGSDASPVLVRIYTQQPNSTRGLASDGTAS
jgi:hypothetical protein